VVGPGVKATDVLVPVLTSKDVVTFCTLPASMAGATWSREATLPNRRGRSPLQGRSLTETVHRTDGEQVIYLNDRNLSLLKELQSWGLKDITHLETFTSSAL